MFLLVLAALLFAGFFLIVLPGGVLLAAVLLKLRRSPAEPAVRPCPASDVTDPASKPCFVYEGTTFCPRHRPLEQTG